MKKLIFAVALAPAVFGGVVPVWTVGSAPIAACPPGSSNC
jgi:hypothetical protein